MCYCDNDGAKACLMTRASSNKAANDLLKLQAAHELKTGIVPWIARVPSKSNVADEPSRELMEELPGFPSAERSTVSVVLLTEGKVLSASSDPTSSGHKALSSPQGWRPGAPHLEKREVSAHNTFDWSEIF